MAEHKLSEQDMVDILEDIASNGGNAAARIAAIKVLREIRSGDTTVSDGFSALEATPARAGIRLKAV